MITVPCIIVCRVLISEGNQHVSDLSLGTSILILLKPALSHHGVWFDVALVLGCCTALEGMGLGVENYFVEVERGFRGKE